MCTKMNTLLLCTVHIAKICTTMNPLLLCPVHIAKMCTTMNPLLLCPVHIAKMCTTMNPPLLCPVHINSASCSLGDTDKAHTQIVTQFVLLSVTHCSYRFRPVIPFPDLQRYQQQSQYSPLSAHLLSNSPAAC